MFTCAYCQKPTGPNVPLRLMEVEGSRRQVTYTVVSIDPETETPFEHQVIGSEITEEFKVCPTCAGVEVKMAPLVDTQKDLNAILSMQEHARRCKKILSDCSVCLLNQRRFLAINPVTINRALSQVPARRFTTSLISVAIDNLIPRTTHDSKRATGEFAAVYPALKAYAQRGGGL